MTIIQRVNTLDRTTECTTGCCALGGVILRSHSGGGCWGAAAAESTARLRFVSSLRGTRVARTNANTLSTTTPTAPAPTTQLIPRVNGRDLRSRRWRSWRGFQRTRSVHVTYRVSLYLTVTDVVTETSGTCVGCAN